MSDYKIYVINFVMGPNINLPAFHQYLNDSVEILAYWNYIPAVYCVKSRLGATLLRDKLRPFLPNSLMIAEINPMNMDGYMNNQEIWQWFFLPAPERKPTPPLGLAGLLFPPPPSNWPKP